MAIRTVLMELVPQMSTSRLTFTAKDELGAPIPAAAFTTLTLTLYVNDALQTIINGLDAENILNAGRGTVDAEGLVIVTLLPADNDVLTPIQALETHIALIEYTWAAGVKAGRHEIEFRVVDLHRVA